MRWHMTMQIVIMIGICQPTVSQAANYTLQGNLTFKYDDTTGVEGTGAGGTGDIPFPQGTLVELVKNNNVVQHCKTSDDAGSYAMQYDVANPDDEFKLRVGIETIKWLDPTNMGIAGHKERVNVNGIIGLEHNWWVQTDNTFKFADANPADNTLKINMVLGDSSDTDSGLVNFERTMREIYVNQIGYNEEYMRKHAAMLLVVDTAYRDIEDTGHIPWLGTMYDQADNGQKIFCPPGFLESMFTDAICWPNNFNIHVRENSRISSVVAHEFGHAVSYHTTSWALLDLADWHSPTKETTPKLAYGEGWAEYFAAAFIESKPNLMDVDHNGVWYALAWVKDASGYYSNYWKGDDSDGTDNSGEIVEGAVAQIMWRSSPGAGGFTARLEDVWKIVRKGATGADNRNSRKTLEDFYDEWMAEYSEAANDGKRQNFRNVCDERGVVYSRAKLTRIASVASKDNFVAASDKLWVSAESKFNLEQMTQQQLKVETEVDEVATDCRFQVCQTGRTTPFVWANVTDAEVQGSTNWKAPFATDTSPDGFYGTLNAINHGLSNSYYLVRGAIDKDGSATTFVKDNLIGPLLGATDASGKNTATWWNGLGIVYQIKVDKEKPVVENRRPAANP